MLVKKKKFHLQVFPLLIKRFSGFQEEMLAQTCPWNQTHQHHKLSKLKLRGSSLEGRTVLGTRAELGTSWSLSGPGTGGACLMLQPRMTADFLLLNTRWIFFTHPQLSRQMKATMKGQPTLGCLQTTLHQAQTKQPKSSETATHFHGHLFSLCSHPFGMKGLTITLKWDLNFGAGSALLSQSM